MQHLECALTNHDRHGPNSSHRHTGMYDLPLLARSRPTVLRPTSYDQNFWSG